MVVCGGCGHAASEPSVGFVCLDCGVHIDSDIAATRDVFSYRLTDQGIGFAEKGGAVLGYAREVLRFAELPLELVVALNAAAKRYNENKTPFALVNILYRKESEVVAEHGARQFARRATSSLRISAMRLRSPTPSSRANPMTSHCSMVSGRSRPRSIPSICASGPAAPSV